MRGKGVFGTPSENFPHTLSKLHFKLAEGLPEISVGQRPTSRASRQTLSEGLHDLSAGQRPASHTHTKKNPHIVPRLKALQSKARGNARVPDYRERHACRAVRVVASVNPLVNQTGLITVPLDKGERARACAGRESSGLLPKIFLTLFQSCTSNWPKAFLKSA